MHPTTTTTIITTTTTTIIIIIIFLLTDMEPACNGRKLEACAGLHLEGGSCVRTYVTDPEASDCAAL